MIEPSTTDNREDTDVVFASAELIQDSSASKRAKTAETLLNILEGRIRNPNTRNAYKTAWRSFFEFCSEYKLELDRGEALSFRPLAKAAPAQRCYPAAAPGCRSASVRSPA